MNQAGAIRLPVTDSSTTKVDINFIGWIKSSFKNNASTSITDKLSFMGTFKYPKLDLMRASLQKSGEYSSEQIEEIIVGLKTLHEYRE